MSSMTGGQAVINSLKSEGIEVVFGVPGEQIMHAYDAFYDNPDVRIITTRHEQTAAFMADGYARSTGKVGVVLVVPGPGVYNVGAGLANAYATSSPILLISGQIDSSWIGKGRGDLHEVHDQREITRPVTKWSTLVNRAEDIPAAIHEAICQLKTGRPLPVEVTIPRDILATTTDINMIKSEEYLRPCAPSDQIQDAANLLLSANRPIIWAGAGVELLNAGADLQELAELLTAPVLVTGDSRGVITDTHPLVFSADNSGDDQLSDLLPRSDVILAFGPRFSIPRGIEWILGPSKALIHMDVEPKEFGRTIIPTLAIRVDSKTGLKQLLDVVRNNNRTNGWDKNELFQIKSAQSEKARQAWPLHFGIGKKVRSVLPNDTIIINGITLGSKLITAGGYPTILPRTLIESSYMITLGYSFPTAMGAKVGNPNKTVLAISGDGGFLYAVGDLATAVQYGINIIILVFNNVMYGNSYYDQKNRFNGRVVGTELINPDFMELAKSFGVKGMRVDNLDDLPSALEKAIVAEQPTLIELSEKPAHALTHYKL